MPNDESMSTPLVLLILQLSDYYYKCVSYFICVSHIVYNPALAWIIFVIMLSWLRPEFICTYFSIVVLIIINYCNIVCTSWWKVYILFDTHFSISASDRDLIPATLAPPSSRNASPFRNPAIDAVLPESENKTDSKEHKREGWVTIQHFPGIWSQVQKKTEISI